MTGLSAHRYFLSTGIPIVDSKKIRGGGENPMTKMPGSRIRALRKAKGWSQVKLAKLVGISQASLSELETGDSHTPSGNALLSLAKHLETDPEFILTGRASPVSEPVKDMEEVELLKLWRELDSGHRSAVLATARALRAQQPKPSKVSPFASAK